jgi:transposase
MAMLHRVRDQPVGQRTATISALRGHLAEFGLVAAQRPQGLGELLAALADLEDDRIPPRARAALASLVGQRRDLEAGIAGLDQRLVQMTRADPVCRALAEIAGVGPVIATAFPAAVPDPGRFSSGRHPAAWLSLVPGQRSTGGKPRPLGLSKRGDAGLGRQPIRGARALVRVSRGRRGGAWSRVEGSLARRPYNVVVAAVANKLRASSGRCRARRGLPSGRMSRRPAATSQEDLHELASVRRA